MDESKTDVIMALLFIIFVFVVVFPTLESDSANRFNKTFDAVKSNTDLLFSKTNMTGSEKTNYIISECQIVFGNSNYRENDVDLCKTKMGLK